MKHSDAPLNTLASEDLGTISAEVIGENILKIQHRIHDVCDRTGRNPQSVRLLPVTKTVSEATLRNAYLSGCRMFGENKVQEAKQKHNALIDLQGLQWAVIGHLQTNKAKEVARFASEFHALDSLKLAEALDRRLEIEGRQLDVFVQVNTSGEASKYGLSPEELKGFISALPVYSNLRIRGLMTLAVFSADPERVRPCFQLLRALRDQVRQDAPEGIQLHELSMGMSGDFEVAIEEGANVVRIGQAIFGARSYAGQAYWPEANR